MSKTRRSRPLRSASHRRRSPPGTPPGLLIVDPDAPKPVITVVRYDAERIEETVVPNVEKVPKPDGSWPVTWISVEGLGDVDVINRIGDIFGLHPLALEDVVNTHQRPKVEEYPEYVFIVTRFLVARDRPETAQLAVFLGGDFVITFLERRTGCFEPIDARLRKGRGQIRQSGPDYLVYTLLDAVVDGYFPVLEHYGEQIDALEEQVMSVPTEGLVRDIHEMKADLLALRRAIWPQREMLNTLVRDRPELIDRRTVQYLRDCYDHTYQLLDVLENYREIASGLIDVYLSSISTRMNEIMKVLTIIATIFIPLSFITGLYGMNFDTAASPWNMPELHWRWGYPYALALMAAVAAGLLWYFRRKGWLGGDRFVARRQDQDRREEPPGDH